MTTLTTHDTKRSEDVRARIEVLSELPYTWLAFVDEVAPRDVVEILVWQAILGSWPTERDRLRAYAVKAAREAGLSTSWADVDVDAEQRLASLVDRVFDDPATFRLVEIMVASVRDAGRVNSLSAKLIQLTMPGVPDVYQGSELWETSLVDPDNRRAVDFDDRRRLLDEIDRPDAKRVPIDDSARAKLLVTSRALRARRDHTSLFTRYTPITAQGHARDHVVCFDRGGAITLATRLPLGLAQGGGWQDTTVVLPMRPYLDVMTGQSVCGGVRSVGELLSDYPVSLLIDTGSAP
jgi:(1->4)-alpha-D-glucan 1-alpha-D-glucosylmutase